MVGRKLSCYNMTEKIILNLKINEFCFSEKNKYENIKGFITHGVATCSFIIISINNDEFVFFAHIHENSDLISEIKKTIVPVLKSNKIENVHLIYSKGQKSLVNKNKDMKIEEMKNIINIIYKPKEKVYFHDNIKLFKISQLY